MPPTSDAPLAYNELMTLTLSNLVSMFFNRKPKPVASTPLSDFIRNASAREKKRVYKQVLEKATESQNRVLARVISAK